MTTLAADIAAVKEEIRLIQEQDFAGRGLEHHTDIRLQRAVERLRRLRDAQFGTNTGVKVGPVPKLVRKAKRKAKQPRNLCHCELERMTDDMSPASGFALDGRLVVNVEVVKPPRMPRATCVRTLCPGCHLPRLFDHAKRWGKSPSLYVTPFHGFAVSEADALWLDERFAEWKQLNGGN